MRETCQQYVNRRLSEGWKIAGRFGHSVYLSPPNGAFLRPVDLRNDVETLRPNAAGDETKINYQHPTSGEHWEKVDEETADDGDTYVKTAEGTSHKRDLYNLPASSGSGTINFIRIYFRCSWDNNTEYARPALKSNSTVTNGTEVTLTSSWVTRSQQWNTNPATGEPWGSDWSVIDNLQIGVDLHAGYGNSIGYCTQVYVEVDYTPIPDPPTNVAATTNLPDKVTVTWTKSAGATKYEVFRDEVGLGELGDVATYDDNGAGAPSITPGDTIAPDGAETAHVALSLSGTGTNNGTTHTYKVKAGNESGWSGYSDSDTGYRAPGALSYQWQRSSADSDADYGNIDGATSSTHNDTAAPAPTITPGDADASDGLHIEHVALSLSGQSANVGDGRYYRCYLTANGCVAQYSGVNRGYRGVDALTYQWQRSSGDADEDYGNIVEATTASYDDTEAPADGSGRYYQCVENATGATEQTSSSDRGYRAVIGLENKSANMAAKMVAAGLI